MAMTQMTPTRRPWVGRGTTPTIGGFPTGRRFGQHDPLTRMHDEMNRLVDSFFGDSSWSMGAPWAGDNDSLATVMQPQLDIAETDESYDLSVELPGVDREHIDLSVDDDALVISARKEREVRDEDDNQYHRVERSFGQFERMLTLPADADSENISAELKNGVLEVTIPRKKDIESTRGRKIEINSG